MRFSKLHGAGNDFVVTEAGAASGDWPALARRITDRHYGVGADGLVLVDRSERADVRMRMFNPDGSEAEMCGNGIRCLAAYVNGRGMGGEEGQLSVETGSGILAVQTYRDDGRGRVERARVGMGRPELRPEAIPVGLPDGGEGPVLSHPLQVDGREYRLAFVSMGNPHAVAFLEEEVSSFPLGAVGPGLERHPLFPRRTNVEIVNVVERGRLRVRVWERGAGLTLACGTGACAAAVASRLLGYTGERAEVELPGGALTVEWDGSGEVFLSGPVEEVFVGEWPT